jgi:hypothetical protein
LLIVVVFTLPASASEEVTVGSFVQRLAQSKKIDSHNARLAVEALSQAGIQLPPDLELSARLTEGDVARISRALGLAVSTNRPNSGFSGEQVDKFFASFRVELALAPDGGALNGAHEARAGAQFDPYTKGKGGSKGQKRGHDFTPTEPE